MSVATESAGSLGETKTEMKLQKFYEEEEGDMIVMEFCQDLVNNVMSRIQTDSLTDQAHNFVVKCAIQAMKKAVEVNYSFHNVPYSEMGGESWKPDVPCEPAQADSWAAYRVPVTYQPGESEQKEEKRESRAPEERQSRSGFVEVTTTPKVSISPSSSSQDVFSIMDYLDDVISTSSEEEAKTSWMEMTDLDLLSQHTAKFSHVSGKTSLSDVIQPISPEPEKFTTSAFSKTTMGEMEKGLCIPHVGNLPTSNVVKEIPDVEEYTLVKVEKRKTKVTKKATVSLPRRRSDTKIKMAPLLEDAAKDKSKERKK